MSEHRPSTKRTNRTKALADSLGRLTKPLFGKRGLADGAVVTDWPNIVSAEIAAHALPEKIAYPGGERRGGTLHLRIDNSAMATELQHLEPLLVERINTYFGYGAVARIKLIHGTLPAQPAPVASKAAAADTVPAPPEVDGIEDTELRAALGSLGQAVAKRRAGD